jgi:hypothetical protein
MSLSHTHACPGSLYSSAVEIAPEHIRVIFQQLSSSEMLPGNADIYIFVNLSYRASTYLRASLPLKWVSARNIFFYHGFILNVFHIPSAWNTALPFERIVVFARDGRGSFSLPSGIPHASSFIPRRSAANKRFLYRIECTFLYFRLKSMSLHSSLWTLFPPCRPVGCEQSSYVTQWRALNLHVP